MNAHPAADLFPMLSDSEYADLRDDIRENGLINAITFWNPEERRNPDPDKDVILDGRNRFKACEELGIEPEWSMYEGDDPVGFVISANLKRRHLSTSQRAMIADELANMKRGNPDFGAIAQKEAIRTSQSDAAAKLQVSRSQVQKAAKLKKEAEPEVVEAVKAGRLNMNQAEKVAELPRSMHTATIDKAIDIAAKERPGKPPTARQVERAVAEVTGREPRPTPTRAREIARDTGKPVPASDGRVYDGRTKEQEDSEVEVNSKNFEIFRALNALAEAEDPREVAERIPAYLINKVDDHLGQAFEWLQIFAIEWRKRHVTT